MLTRGKQKVMTCRLTLSESSEFFLHQLYEEDAVLRTALDGAIGVEQRDDDSKGEGSMVIP